MRPSLLLALLLVGGCGTPRPIPPRPPTPVPIVSVATVEEEDDDDEPLPPEPEEEEVVAPPPPPPPPPPPAPVYLYTRTDADLRLAYVDGLSGLLNAAATPGQARRVSPTDARAWLDVLGGVNLAAASFVRRQLGPVLNEGALAAYAITGSNPSSCARMSETLLIGVPEKHQGQSRPYVGLIARDACEGQGALCLRCTNVGGPPAGDARPRVCTLAHCGR